MFVYEIVCLVYVNYMLQDGGSTNFYAGLTHHRYPTVKCLVGIIRVGAIATTLKETTLMSWNVCGTTILTRHEFCMLALFIFCVMAIYDVHWLYFLCEYFWESMGHRCSLRLVYLTHTNHVTDSSVLCIRGRFYMKHSRMYLCRFSIWKFSMELLISWSCCCVELYFAFSCILFIFFVSGRGPICTIVIRIV